jgi:hypothetical protein
LEVREIEMRRREPLPRLSHVVTRLVTRCHTSSGIRKHLIPSKLLICHTCHTYFQKKFWRKDVFGTPRKLWDSTCDTCDTCDKLKHPTCFQWFALSHVKLTADCRTCDRAEVSHVLFGMWVGFDFSRRWNGLVSGLAACPSWRRSQSGLRLRQDGRGAAECEQKVVRRAGACAGAAAGNSERFPMPRSSLVGEAVPAAGMGMVSFCGRKLASSFRRPAADGQRLWAPVGCFPGVGGVQRRPEAGRSRSRDGAAVAVPIPAERAASSWWAASRAAADGSRDRALYGAAGSQSDPAAAPAAVGWLSDGRGSIVRVLPGCAAGG